MALLRVRSAIQQSGHLGGLAVTIHALCSFHDGPGRASGLWPGVDPVP